ncbi:MAG: Protease production enhancer protein [Candidatus Accumulibacter appositus]|uniref:Protease production enhancer protein n=1 Tax=Candidatus Accumulibacter appositus TaxID=1454003 RepID=A0A011N7X7_9PROT|nr:response regulator [Accumulibacter sp.]EXI78703.1 MAG: Protease production enhancer protein [Candidatus Accumulibacter appositus]HRF03362.1 response regulator [Accumulibacter sp.]
MSGLRVLLVDDSPDFRKLLARMLRALGFEIAASVGSGEEALRILDGEPADVVILDIAMPGLSGLETAQRIRQMSADTKLLILSLHSTPEYQEAAAAIGVDAYVCKANLVPELPRVLAELAA